jgi:hypothetical protein
MTDHFRRARIVGGGLAAIAMAAFVQTAAAQNYTVNVTQELNGLDIKVEPVSNVGLLVVNLTNNTAQKVKCSVNFQADPQLPNRSFVFVEPGKSSSATLRATQKWYEVDVDVKCKADN